MIFDKFTEHPREVRETYFEHMRHAGSYAVSFFILSLKCVVHMIFPWIFNGCISAKVCNVADHIRGRIDE